MKIVHELNNTKH